jgi:alkanesulfonate monooxygenase SsuD/methylene tetrahydromethanopterin reductase-like flavin-dependent oxidoreductase (luciferase family)
MRLGLVHINMRQLSQPAALAAAARAAEAAGFDSLWAGEHVVLPDPQVPLPGAGVPRHRGELRQARRSHR